MPGRSSSPPWRRQLSFSRQPGMLRSDWVADGGVSLKAIALIIVILELSPNSKGAPMGPFHGTFWFWWGLFYGPLVGIWYILNWVHIGVQLRGPYQGTTGSTLDKCSAVMMT